jgi:hypothetical protein
MRILGSVLALAVAVTMLCGATAYADSLSLGQLELMYSSARPARTAYVYLGGSNVTGNDGTNHGNVYTGQYNLQINPGFTPTGEGVAVKETADIIGGNYILGTFCTDILQNAPTGGTYRRYDVYLPQNAPIGGGNVAMNDAKAWDLRRLFSNNQGFIGTADGAAAFEAAVWEIVYETSGTYNVDYHSSSSDGLTGTRGNFFVDPTSGTIDESGKYTWVTTANTWLGALGTGTPDIGLRVLASEGYQDFSLVVTGLGKDSSIPEPVTMAGLMLGIGGLSGYIRRRRRA